METKLFEPEEDLGRAEFQQELNRWFQSRGIFTELRSHLRHLLIKALQNSQVVGVKATDRNSPKSGAMCLMIAEYLFRLGCHYTLSVFTSEVSSLVNFNPEGVLRSGSSPRAGRKVLSRHCFQQTEVDDIFDALGMCSREEEIELAKVKYFEEGSETCLIELLLQTILQMASRLKIKREIESRWQEGERFLSKEWSSRVIKILTDEKMSSEQVAAVEEALFRMTENEIQKLIEKERQIRMDMLTNREKRIQEYLKKHEDEIFSRLKTAEQELATRKASIDDELAERERHLAEMAFEWNNKHEEILQLSRNFHSIETDNQNLQKRLKELEEENRNLKTQGETQTKTIDGLLGEMNLLMNKLREATDSNSALSERIQALINLENKEAPVQQDGVNQDMVKALQEEIPLLWFKNMSSDVDLSLTNQQNRESSPKRKFKFTIKNSEVWHRDRATNVNIGSGDAHGSGSSDSSEAEDAEEDVVSQSSSFDEIIVGVRKKLQNLEEHSNRLNQNYLEFKLKCVSPNSDSESSDSPSPKPSQGSPEEVIMKETKFCQTDAAQVLAQDTYAKIQKLNETRERRCEFEACPSKKPELTSPPTTVPRMPSLRQLQNRDFFVKSRQLLQAFEKHRAAGLHTSASSMESFTCGSEDERAGCSQKKSPIRAVPLKISINPKKDVKSSLPEVLSSKPPPVPVPVQPEMDCLNLLEDARIKSPQVSARMPLRQQILLSESDEERENSRTGFGSPPTISSGIISVGKRSEGSG